MNRALFLVLFFLITCSSFGQKVLYQEDHDSKPFYFGISLGISKAGFKTDLDPSFLQQDSIMVAEPLSNGGFNLGLLATMRLTRRFELRFNPQLMFMERNIYYRLKYKDIDYGYDVNKKVESVITTFPFQVKFNSDRIGNFRVYMLGGGKFDIDLASNAKARKADDMIRINRFDYGVEAGVGFNFYFPSFILSPEVKISNGLSNLHDRNEKLNYSRVLEAIQSRMIVFTIHLEG
ncbi:MAG: type IX secretion/gliding motility protein PorT/SprT [Flavisolibacter sp.]